MSRVVCISFVGRGRISVFPRSEEYFPQTQQPLQAFHPHQDSTCIPNRTDPKAYLSLKNASNSFLFPFLLSNCLALFITSPISGWNGVIQPSWKFPSLLPQFCSKPLIKILLSHLIFEFPPSLLIQIGLLVVLFGWTAGIRSG